MFGRSKTQLTPPTPPTFAQILEDMETFQVEKPIVEKVRTYDAHNFSGGDTSSSFNTSVTNNVNEWWKTFETFQCDVHDMKQIRRDFRSAKQELSAANTQIQSQSDRIKADIEKAIRIVEESQLK